MSGLPILVLIQIGVNAVKSFAELSSCLFLSRFFPPSQYLPTFEVNKRVLHAGTGRQMTRGVNPSGNDGPGG